MDEYGLSIFLKLQYELGHHERMADQLLVFEMNFQKHGGQAMKAELGVRERKTDDMVELILIRAHAEPL